MTWLWPSFLYLLILIPLLIVVYILILRRRQRFAVRYSSLALVRDALPRRSWLRQHLPFIFFLLALTGLIVALARPVNVISVPAGKATIILTIDVSRSMCSTDIKPTRIQAAENAALSFIQRQSSNTQIGLVAFSSFAELIQPPTNDRNLLDAAVKSLLVGRRTAIGSGILAATGCNCSAWIKTSHRASPIQIRELNRLPLPKAHTCLTSLSCLRMESAIPVHFHWTRRNRRKIAACEFTRLDSARRTVRSLRCVKAIVNMVLAVEVSVAVLDSAEAALAAASEDFNAALTMRPSSKSRR